MKNQHPKLKESFRILAFNVIFTFSLLLLLEIALRVFGFQPGGKEVTSFNFMEVDSVYLTNEFNADSLGITKANPLYPWDSAFEINQLGFRTNELDYILNKPKSKRLLLIGDSFTWGLTATPITKCFADLLDSTDFAVFNSGIPTVGPNQYLKIAEQLIPVLEPELVAVFFYIKNDLFPKRIPLKPYQVAYYKTNAGIFSAYVNGDYIESPNEAYQYYKNIFYKSFSSKKVLSPIVNWLLKNSVVCYKFYNLYRNLKYTTPDQVGTAYLYYLNEIKAISDQYGSKFKLFIIPDNGKHIDTTLFPGLSPMIPKNLEDNDYESDGHFNNKGHRKFFKYVFSQIQN